MKLVRFGNKDNEKPGLVDPEGNIRDLSNYFSDFTHEGVSLATFEKIKNIEYDKLPKVPRTSRLGSCLADTPNFYCIGLNYAKHAKETNADIPKEPIVFSKATTSINGPNDDVIIPRGSVKADWEVELGVIIGKHCQYVSEKDALSVVSGYCIVNDVSERSFQFDRGGQWIKGKSAPTFAPIGPFLVTAEEIENPQNLNLQLKLNNNVVQKSNTSDMIFTVSQIISHLSHFMALRPGDIIATGTPEGVGIGMKPPVFLKDGDIMELEIDFLGSQKQKVIDYQ
tara:strand:+ start:1807 stop:2652 length:846 start_codon:yes stop_codon:yes gene_type:complete